MSSTGGTQRSSGNGFFVGNGDAAKAGNDALAKGFDLAKAAAAAREKTGSGPGQYFSGSKKQYEAQTKIANRSPAYFASRSQAVSKSNQTRWTILQNTTGTTKGGRQGFKDKGV